MVLRNKWIEVDCGRCHTTQKYSRLSLKKNTVIDRIRCRNMTCNALFSLEESIRIMDQLRA